MKHVIKSPGSIFGRLEPDMFHLPVPSGAIVIADHDHSQLSGLESGKLVERADMIRRCAWRIVNRHLPGARWLEHTSSWSVFKYRLSTESGFKFGPCYRPRAEHPRDLARQIEDG